MDIVSQHGYRLRTWISVPNSDIGLSVKAAALSTTAAEAAALTLKAVCEASVSMVKMDVGPHMDNGFSTWIMVPSMDIGFSAWISAPNLHIGSKLGFRVECEGGGLEYDGGEGVGLDDEGGVCGVCFEGQRGCRLHTRISGPQLG